MANQVTIISREWFNEPLNGASFGDNLSELTDYPKFLLGERVKYVTNFTVQTNLVATPAAEISFSSASSVATFTHPYLNWSTEGFKVGDTVRIVRAASNTDVTISTISGNVMTCADLGIAAALSITSGNSYDDLEFRNTTTPTSCVFKFGLIPNSLGGTSLLPSDPYKTWCDSSQSYVYKVDDIDVSATPFTPIVNQNSDTTETLTMEYITNTDAWIFEFQMVHIFRVDPYKPEHLSIIIDGNDGQPPAFASPNYRYVCEWLFGVSSTDPNENRRYKDFLLNGSVGFIGQNFTSGVGDYERSSFAHDSGFPIEVTETNAITIQIEKTSGNFAAGQKAIVIFMKLPSESEMQDVTESWDDLRVFDQLTQTEGAVAVNGTYIKNLEVDINASPQFLDITCDIEFDSTAQTYINEGDYYFVGVLVWDSTIGAATSDRKLVWCAVNQFTKNPDVPNLVTSLTTNFYTSEKRPGTGLKTTNVDTWNNRLHFAEFIFNLAKFADSADCNIVGLKGQVVSRNSTTGEVFLLDNFNIPFQSAVVDWTVDGTTYQAIDYLGDREFNINPSASTFARQVIVNADDPSSFDPTQQWRVVFPFVIPWRQWVFNINVPGSFYNIAQEQNNRNFRTSNYSQVGDWDIYIRLLATINCQGVNTEYALYSGESIVRDFDVDPDTFNWTADTRILDEDGNEVDYIVEGQDMTIETEFSMPTAGAISLSRFVGEITIEESGSSGSNWRLQSTQDWYYSGNLLKPLDGETKVTIEQDVPNNLVTIRCKIDKDLIDPSKSYNIYSHLQDIT